MSVKQVEVMCKCGARDLWLTEKEVTVEIGFVCPICFQRVFGKYNPETLQIEPVTDIIDF